MSQVDISVIIVSYNSMKVLPDCLDSLLGLKPEVSFEIIVVDNHGADGVASMIEERYPGVRLIKSPGNRGFSAGNNLGMLHASGRYFLLLNPDTIAVDDLLTGMVRFMDAHPGAGIAGCRLVDPNHRQQKSFARRVFKNMELADTDVKVENGWVSGAVMAIRREAVQQAGGLDEGFFFEGEDVEFCIRVSSYGWEIWFTPCATVVHLEGQSRKRSNGMFHYKRRKSVMRLFAKHAPLKTMLLWRLSLILMAVIGIPLILLLSPIWVWVKSWRYEAVQGMIGTFLVGVMAALPYREHLDTSHIYGPGLCRDTRVEGGLFMKTI